MTQRIILQDNCRLEEIPEDLYQLSPWVEELHLAKNRLSYVPPKIASFHSLKKLFLSYNKITTFPVAVCQLQFLRTLSLKGNLLTSVPESIGDLSNLEWLNLANNKLKSLPANFDRLQKLQGIYLQGNPMVHYPIHSWTTMRELYRIFLDSDQVEYLSSKIKAKIEIYDSGHCKGALLHFRVPFQMFLSRLAEYTLNILKQTENNKSYFNKLPPPLVVNLINFIFDYKISPTELQDVLIREQELQKRKQIKLQLLSPHSHRHQHRQTHSHFKHNRSASSDYKKTYTPVRDATRSSAAAGKTFGDCNGKNKKRTHSNNNDDDHSDDSSNRHDLQNGNKSANKTNNKNGKRTNQYNDDNYTDDDRNSHNNRDKKTENNDESDNENDNHSKSTKSHRTSSNEDIKIRLRKKNKGLSEADSCTKVSTPTTLPTTAAKVKKNKKPKSPIRGRSRTANAYDYAHKPAEELAVFGGGKSQREVSHSAGAKFCYELDSEEDRVSGKRHHSARKKISRKTKLWRSRSASERGLGTKVVSPGRTKPSPGRVNGLTKKLKHSLRGGSADSAKDTACVSPDCSKSRKELSNSTGKLQLSKKSHGWSSRSERVTSTRQKKGKGKQNVKKGDSVESCGGSPTISSKAVSPATATCPSTQQKPKARTQSIRFIESTFKSQNSSSYESDSEQY